MPSLDDIFNANAKAHSMASTGNGTEPGWFEPGSTSEALTRGFANASTLGAGKYIQAPIYSAIGAMTGPSKFSWNDIMSRINAEKEANADAAKTNPVAYTAGSVVGSLPQAAGIASVARAAPTILGAVGRGAGLGATAGGVQGAADTPPEGSVLGSTARGAGVGAVTGGLTGGLTGKAAAMSGNKVVESLAGQAAVAPAAMSNVTLPGLGALGSMAYRNIQADNPTDWTTDPYSAAIETGKAGLVGAGAGLATKYGSKAVQAVGNAAGDAIKQGMVTLGTNAGNGITRPVITGTVAAPANAAGVLVNPPEKHSFNTLRDYLDSNAQDEDEKRRLAMELQSSPEGRQFANGDLQDEGSNQG